MRAASHDSEIRAGGVLLRGQLLVPAAAKGVVVFVHGSGSSRLSPRNRQVARQLHDAALGTLLFDLLTEEEERADVPTGRYRFDVEFLARRLVAVTDWLRGQMQRALPLGYFGASTGAAAALMAAAVTASPVTAIVSRGGRPDLAGEALDRVEAATLLIVGSEDFDVLQLNRAAFNRMHCEKELVVVPGATHLFQEPGALERVAQEAARWFQLHFRD